jgi:putative PIN family toxin of toxin-antitoxin system
VRITLDTNILVRGHQNASGPCRSLLNLIVESNHILVLSQSLLYELEEVMRYPRVRKLTGLSEAQSGEYVGYLAGVAELVDIGQAVPFSTPDADDWVVLRTAIQGDADILCSLDRHLWRPELAGVYEQYRITLVADVQLLNLLRLGV